MSSASPITAAVSPWAFTPKWAFPAVTVVYTILHAGGKFGGEGYKVSGGLHGVGASVVNALSEWLIVEVKNGEHIYQQKFARGVAQGDLTIIGDTDETGTRVTFKPDGEIFEELVYDYETLHTRLREQAFLNAGVRMTITDRRTPHGPQRFHVLRGRHPLLCGVHPPAPRSGGPARGCHLHEG